MSDARARRSERGADHVAEMTRLFRVAWGRDEEGVLLEATQGPSPTGTGSELIVMSGAVRFVTSLSSTGFR